MKKSVQILIIAFIGVVTVNTAKAQTYDPYDVQVINNIIKNNGLQAEPDNPESWSPSIGPFHIQWTGETPKKIRELDISYCSLKGAVSVAGLTKMTYLNCSDNGQMNKIDATNCSSLIWVSMGSSAIFEINLTGIGHEVKISGYQHPGLTLYKNNEGKYSLPISLNEPVFYEMIYGELPPYSTISTTITYKNGILESSDNTVIGCWFNIKPIGYDYSNYFEGSIGFDYSEEPMEINAPDKEELKIYPNPTYNTLFIECSFTISSSLTVKLYDMFGKEVLTRNTNCNDRINISRLEKGSYIVTVFSEGKVIGNTKIVKQ